MGQKFCTTCGSVLTEGVKFCERCGAAVEQAPPSSTPDPVPQAVPVTPPLPVPTAVPVSPALPVPPASVPVATPPPAPKPRGKPPVKIIAGIVLLIVLAAAFIFVLPGLSGSGSPFSSLGGTVAPTPAPVITAPPVVTTSTPLATPTVPTPPPDPFPNAYALREIFSFNEGKYASRATVYRYWMNDTYQWHNDLDNHYYVQRPKAGNKYLFVFINIENIGTDGYPYPKANSILVHNDGTVYTVDPTHYLPDKAGDRKATAVEILELEQQSDFFKMERVEDYGYSHGTTQDFVLPGQGNAIDGYLVYEVPASVTAEKTYVDIAFDGQDRAVWKLG